MAQRFSKRRQLLARWLSDVSKIFFGLGIAKQIVERPYNLKEVVFGAIISFIMLLMALLVEPEE